MSGAAGLIYEVVWARQLTLFIGNTAIANAAVLTAFMVGLASGSLVLGRIADVIAKPLRMYALFEILIACYGATTPWLFGILQTGYTDLAGVVGVTGSYSHLPRFLIAIIAMLIPTFLMGGTLPLLVKHFTRHLDEAQTVTSRIYGINTLGATLGAFSAGFLLLPGVGITQTLLIAATANLLVGLGVYQLLARQGVLAFNHVEEPVEKTESQQPTKLAYPWLLLLGFGLSGFAALLYQVVWIHALVLVIGVSTYAFSTVVTVFLAGIGLGSLLVGRLLAVRDAWQSLKVAFYLQLAISLSAVVSLSLISQLPVMFVYGYAKLHTSFALFQSYMFFLTALIIFLPTLLLGALFPIITGLWSSRKGAVGQGVGEAYGANAIGTIAGSAIGGLFILDWLGIAGSLYLASAVSILVAVIFWFMSSPGRPIPYRLLQLSSAATLLVLVIQVLPGWDRDILQAQVFRQADRYLGEDIRGAIKSYMSKKQFLYYKEGIHGTISVVGWKDNGVQRKALINNGRVDASSHSDAATQILLGQIPMFLHEAPKQVMVIGQGSGMTAGSILQNPVVENLDILEISPEVVEASNYFRQENYNVLNNPRTNLIVADGRNYLLASEKKYDIIVSEPSHPWVSGVSNLFTREFFQQAKSRLNENGILAQWCNLYGMDQNSLKALLRSIADVFPNYTLWYGGSRDIIIVSSNKPLDLDYQEKSLFLNTPGIRDDLQRIDIDSVEEMMSHIIMSSDQTRELLVGQKANTDDNAVVEFNAPKYLYQRTTGDNYSMLFNELPGGIYPLPVFNLVNESAAHIDVPFMGIRLVHEGDDYSVPEWDVVRRTVYNDETQRHRLAGGMRGEMVLQRSWGDVVIRSTMVKRGAPDDQVLSRMLASEVPGSRQTLAGEMRAQEIVIHWRVGHSTRAGLMKAVLARKCQRESEFDNWISFSSILPGNAENQEAVSSVLRQLNGLVQCIE